MILRLQGIVTQVSTSAPLVALTFDDGPHPEFTPKVVDLLERHGARATFFMAGEAARRYPRIVAG
jgi:peptidoglycan/xylan/chitin deacetylase (PgdA/CDA1 family)